MITKQAEDMLEKKAFLWKGLWSLGKGIAGMGKSIRSAVPNGVQLPRLGNGLEGLGKATKRFAANEVRPLQNKMTNFAGNKLQNLSAGIGRMATKMSGPTMPKAPALNAGIGAAAPGADIAANRTQSALGRIPNFIKNNKFGLGITALGVPGAISSNNSQINNEQ